MVCYCLLLVLYWSCFVTIVIVLFVVQACLGCFAGFYTFDLL